MSTSALTEAATDAVPRYAVDIGIAGVAVVFAAPILLELPYGSHRCPLPGAPPWWRGAINHRGFVVPRFDIARWLGHDDGGARIEVIVDSAPHSTAWLLTRPPELLLLRAARERSIPAAVPEALRPYINAVWSSDSAVVIELEHRKLLASLGRAERA